MNNINNKNNQIIGPSYHQSEYQKRPPNIQYLKSENSDNQSGEDMFDQVFDLDDLNEGISSDRFKMLSIDGGGGSSTSHGRDDTLQFDMKTKTYQNLRNNQRTMIKGGQGESRIGAGSNNISSGGRSNSEYVAFQRKLIDKELSTPEKSKALLRLRPLIKKEQGQSTIFEERDGKIFDSLREKTMKIESDISIFGEKSSTENIYEQQEIEQLLFKSIENGQNLSVFSFGHTGAGKSFTMFGNKEKNPGILPLMLESIFAYIYEKIETEFMIRVSYVEIFNEQINDLLSPNSSRTAGSFVEKTTEEICINIDQIFSLIRMGDINRQIGTSKSNDRASKATIIFRIIIESFSYTEPSIDKLPLSVINLVDLGGSEVLNEKEDPDRNSVQAREASFLIKSMITLEQIVSILSEGNEMNEWIPYRDSKLTRFLQAYLEGNSRMFWICNISPAENHYRVNKKTIEFANKIPGITQSIKNNSISFQDSMLFRVKKQIALLKQQYQKMEALIQKKDQFYASKNKTQQPNNTGGVQQFDSDVDEKLRLTNEIKKLTNQILVCDRVSHFMKKFDRKRSSTVSNEVQKRRGSLFERMQKKIDNARDFIREKNIESKFENGNENYDIYEQTRNSSAVKKKSMSRKTVGELQRTVPGKQNSQQESQDLEAISKNNSYQIGRLSILDQMMDDEDSKKVTEENLLDDNFDDLANQNPLLLTNNSDTFESFNKKSAIQSIRLNQQQVDENILKEPLEEEENDSIKDDEELEDEDENEGEQADTDQSQHGHDDFYAIQEEDDEEDSFEKERKNRKEKLQRDYERKLDEIERRYAGSFFNNLPIRDNRTCVTHDQFQGFDTPQNDLMNVPDDEDEDLLVNFDGIPKISIIEMLDQHRESIKPPNQRQQQRDTITRDTMVSSSAQSRKTLRKSMIGGNSQSTMLAKNGSLKNLSQTQPIPEVSCSKCQGKVDAEDLKSSLLEADKNFLESLVFSKDNEIEQLKEQLKQRDQQNQELVKEKNELLTYIVELEKQINEITQNDAKFSEGIL